jgi:secreted trypsin-like serine protease
MYKRYCNSTHMNATGKVEKKIQASIPQLFQNNLICAGVTVGHQGPCVGDSGGPLMYKDLETGKFVQIATVSSGVGECGDDEYPGIYVRLDHPSTLNFILSTIQKNKGTILR